MRKTTALIIIALMAPFPTAFGSDGAETSISQTGTPEAGRLVFQKCRACHSLDDKSPALTGPNLDNIFGRMAGTSKSYSSYSKALKESGIIWSELELDNWLRDPNNYLPGNKMPFAGLRSAQDRADLMAYIRAANERN